MWRTQFNPENFSLDSPKFMLFSLQDTFIPFLQSQKSWLIPASTVKSEVQSLSKYPLNHIGEIWDTIPPNAKFLSSYKPMKSDKLGASKIKWQGWHKICFPIIKRRNWKERRNDVSVSWKSKTSKANSIGF